MKTLSIIIVSYNTSKITVASIRSILKHKPPFSYEIIVIDNNSLDDSVSQLKKLKPSIKLIVNKKNRGFAKANNQGMKLANGTYVLLLNSDTLVTARVFEKLVEFAKKHTDAGVVAPQLLNADQTIQPSVYRLPTISRAIAQYWLLRGSILDKYIPDGREAQVVESVVGAAFLITPAALTKVGMLNEKYFMYFEDLDYCRAVKKVGLKVYYVPSLKIMHIHGASGNKKVNLNLIAASKQYFGLPYYYLYTFILWSGQKMRLFT